MCIVKLHQLRTTVTGGGGGGTWGREGQEGGGAFRKIVPPWIPRTVAVFPALSSPTITKVTFLLGGKRRNEGHPVLCPGGGWWGMSQ